MTSPNGTIRSTTGTPDAPASHLVLALTLHMDSDWHCGTGLGIPGGIDKLVNTDHDGLPFVPGKTLTGVWRDACELAAAALDGSTSSTGPAGGWHAWVEFLFGSQPVLSAAGSPTGDKPRPAALSVRPARYPAALAAALRSDEQRRLRDATTFVRPGVKIDPSTGRAADKFLRFEQMARCGVQLTASATLADWSAPHPGGEDPGGENPDDDGLDDDGRRAAAALLLLGARLVESIGGKRRRGAGRCRLEVTQVEP
ncbi:RAMP superfamily CRISPR-associated protein, partial [Protofrankia symbiont of Coriaria ruscifolia]|uniref:RAMP superfamily CRISPR-associated protein n=1 Tax=Protofrankia symbiont of Coriaria ruscifolia TaxID=1306542 RepID=UPI001A943D49